MAKHSFKNNKSPDFYIWGKYYYLSLLQSSIRLFRINWGILEEMKKTHNSFIVTCVWPQALYCFFAFKKHRFPMIANSNQNSTAFFIEKLGYRVWQAPENSASDDAWETFGKRLEEHPRLWIPIELEQKGGVAIIQMVQWAQKYKIPIVPVGFSAASDLVFSVSDGMQFPYPFSQAAMLVSNPIQMGNLPVEQACSMVKQAFHHLDKSTRDVLQTAKVK